MSSESDPEDLDFDEINDIKVDSNDINELDRLVSTTKKHFCTSFIHIEAAKVGRVKS